MTESVKKPRLIAVGGMIGSGKTTLARNLAAIFPDSILVDADAVAKLYHGVAPHEKLPLAAYQGAMGVQIGELINDTIRNGLRAGKTVIFTGSLTCEGHRKDFKIFAEIFHSEFTGIILHAPLKTRYNRVAKRKNDVSDANTDDVQKEGTGYGTFESAWPVIDSSESAASTLRQATDILGATMPALMEQYWRSKNKKGFAL